MSAGISHDMARVGDRYTSDAMICSTCRGLLIRPHETVEENTPASYDFDSIVQSASDGCPICEIFYQDLTKENAPEKLSIGALVTFRHKPGSSKPDERVPVGIELKTDKANIPWRLNIELLSALSYGSNSQAQVDVHYGHPKTFPVKAPIDAVNTGDHRCLEMAAAWLRTCSTNHEVCNSNHNLAYSAVRPARVLDASTTTVRLVSKVSWTTEGNPAYMTVSHKWKSRGMPKLLKCNIGEMHQALKLQTLPATFRDAVALARALKIRYVWIDALCIVQDDSDELQHEISNMGQNYRNAFLNVGALQAAEAREDMMGESPGLFVDRDPQDVSPFALSIQRGNLKKDCFAYRGMTAGQLNSGDLGQLNSGSLMKRGWVLQERLLSRRSIYFGTQIWWECGEQLACEPFPGQIPIFSSDGGVPGWDTPYRITNFLALSSATDSAHENTHTPIYIYHCWVDITETFSRCKLSFEQDYLVALSGLAQEFQKALGDDYYAGLWGDDMFTGLLWQRNTLHYNDDAARPKEYRAPSWSWASFNLEIRLLMHHLSYDFEEIIAEILEISTTPIGPDPTSRISSGHLCISGHLRRSQRTLSKRYTRHVNTWSMDGLIYQYECFDEGYMSDGTRPMDMCLFFLIGYAKHRETRDVDAYTLTNAEAKGNQVIEGDQYSVDLGCVYGLILEVVGFESSVYRRIGSFRHMWGDGRTYYDNPRPEDYPEFLDFDPENFERHIITII